MSAKTAAVPELPVPLPQGSLLRQNRDQDMPARQWQEAVDTHFLTAATYWRDLYQADGLFEVIHRQRRDLVLSTVARLAVPRQAPVLEIGCGAGATAIPLAQSGYVVDAVDTVDEMLRLTREAAVKAGVGERVRTQANDAHYLTFADRSFSLVVAMGVTPYLHSLNDALREMARVLEPGGHLIVNADNRWRLNYVLDPRRFPVFTGTRRTLGALLERTGLRKPTPTAPRPQMYSLRELDGSLAAAGLQKLEGRTLGFGPFSFLNYNLFSESLGVKLHNKLQGLADRRVPLLRSTGAQYIVVARKPALDIRGHAA